MEVRKSFVASCAPRQKPLASALGITACLLFITVLACSPTRSVRGGMPPPRQTPEEIMAMVKKRLNLSKEQETKVKPIIEEQCEARDEIIEKYRGQGRKSRRSMRNELQTLQEVTEEKLAAVLTQEQIEEYRKMQEERRQKMREQMKQRRGGGRRGGMGGGRGGMGGIGWPHGI